jgi:hypothetical protein
LALQLFFAVIFFPSRVSICGTRKPTSCVSFAAASFMCRGHIDPSGSRHLPAGRCLLLPCCAVHQASRWHLPAGRRHVPANIYCILERGTERQQAANLGGSGMDKPYGGGPWISPTNGSRSMEFLPLPWSAAAKILAALDERSSRRWSLCYGAKETAREFIAGSTGRHGSEEMRAMEQHAFLRAVTVNLPSPERWGRDMRNSWRLVFLFFSKFHEWGSDVGHSWRCSHSC